MGEFTVSRPKGCARPDATRAPRRAWLRSSMLVSFLARARGRENRQGSMFLILNICVFVCPMVARGRIVFHIALCSENVHVRRAGAVKHAGDNSVTFSLRQVTMRWPPKSFAQTFHVVFAFSRNLNGVGQTVLGECILTRQRDCNAEQGVKPVHL